MSQEGRREQRWTFPEGAIAADDSIKGFQVEAADGSAGRVSWASYAPGESYLVVSVRHHFHEVHRVVPAGMVERIDVASRQVWLRLKRAEIEALPTHHDPGAPLDSSTVEAFERAIATLPRSGDMF